MESKMREGKSQTMSDYRSSKKGRSTISKKDLKISLVAKRLSMLQDDHPTPPVLSQENPVLCESIKPSVDFNDDTITEDIVIFKSSQNQMNCGSHKRARVISDDESSDDGEAIACIQPIKRGRPKKKVKSSDSASNEDYKASNNPIREKIQRMDLTDPLSAGNKSSSMKRAEEVRANLSAECPSFVKLMLKSHVSGGFWLGLPKKFCDEHLPVQDCIVVLVDEAEEEFSTNYLVAKSGLSGGWRGFAIDHDLHEGDVVVFHLIEPTKFKIYIVREQSYGEVDGALGLLTFGLAQQKSVSHDTRYALQTEDYNQKALQTQDNYPVIDHPSQSSSDVDLGPEVLDGVHFSDSDIKFEGVEGFENFNITVDGLVINSKFSENTRKKYFELCCNEGLFLHEHLLKGLNCNLVVGIISETINIADAIKSCKKGSVSHEDLQTWEKTLKGFEFLGMEVASLCTRVNQLQGLDFEPKTGYESNRLKESIIKRAFAGENMKVLENSLTQVTETMEKIKSKMEADMKVHEDKFTQLKETMNKIDSQIEAEMKVANAWKQEDKIKKITAV